jgi:pantetheine-phosphate adenylyltransferase
MKRALFPGTFDPITKGHCELLGKGLMIFDEIIIAIGTNSKKHHMFDLPTRMEWISRAFEHEKRIHVMHYHGLTVDVCRQQGASFILRGLRNATDFEYEQSIAHANKELAPDIETIFVLSTPSFATISSSIVREVIAAGGDYTRFVPSSVKI